MKFKSFIILMAAALATTSCNQEEETPNALQVGVNELYADVEGNSRSLMNEKTGAFSWASGDQISVWNGNSFTTFSYTSGNTFSSTTTITPQKYAVYPAGNHKFSNNKVTINLPTEYGSTSTEYTPNTNAAMVASVENSNTIAFKHVGGVMRFYIKDIPAGANQFVFTSNDKDITGDFKMSGEQITAANKSDKNTVTINFKASNSKQNLIFYVPLPTGTYTGYKVEIKAENGSIALANNSTSAINTIHRKTLLLIPTFTCNDDQLTKESKTINVSNNNTNNNKAEVSGGAVEINTNNAAEDATVELAYTPDVNNPTLNISDNSSSSTEPTASVTTVNVTVPHNSKVEMMNIEAPTLTVELSAKNNGTAVYETVTARTATNTLIINAGVTVNKLILNGGNVAIKKGATVGCIEKATGFDGKTNIEQNGTLEEKPKFDDVAVYELRVLTFEDEDAKFEPYNLDYVNDYEGKDIYTWSDLIDDPQYGGPLTYGNGYASGTSDAMYYWYDQGNTELYHMFPDNYSYCFAGGGHAISKYWGSGYTDEDRNKHIANYYGQEYVDQWAGKPGADAALGWFSVQMMVPIKPHSGKNFAVHYGYKDFFSFIENLPEIRFEDGKARVIDHMYVTNTNYTLNQLVNGVKSEEGNTFGGNWTGLNEDAWLKIVAYGFDDVEADADAEPISEVEFYLVQGENVVTDWQKWDLSELGEVVKVRFNFEYSENMGGSYGFTIPGYFAYDDVAVRFEN